MTRRFLFIGTSFLGAIQQGWNTQATGEHSLFVGFNAPALATVLARDWRISNHEWNVPIRSFVAGRNCSNLERKGIASFSELAIADNFVVPLQDFTHVIFVDLFHRPVTSLRMNAAGHLDYSGTPISIDCARELRFNGYQGHISLQDHPRHGTIPMASAKPMLHALRNAMPQAKIALIASPRPFSSNFDGASWFGSAELAKRSFDFIDDEYEHSLKKYGIEYLRPAENLCEETGQTPDHFSRGQHSKKPNRLDPHANADYGTYFVTPILRWSQEAA